MAGTQRLGRATELRWLPNVIISCRYRLKELIGRGSFGEVWAAEDIDRVRQPVAIKRLIQAAASEQLRRRFVKEMEALKLLRRNPNIVALQDYGEYLGQDYLVMEHLKGQTLADWLKRQNRPTPLGTALSIIEQICHGLHAAHTQRIVHRDLKPGNIMLLPTGREAWLVKVLDFGVARVGGCADTSSGGRVGTDGYMPPEQSARGWGDVCSASDVFSIGVLCIELLTLRAGSPDAAGSPYANFVVQRWSQLAGYLRAVRPDVPAQLWAPILRSLQPRIHDRPADAGALWRDLQRARDASYAASSWQRAT